MIELFTTFSLVEIVTFIVLLALAVKSVWEFVEWAMSKYKAKFSKEYTRIRKDENAEEQQKKLEAHYVNCKLQYDSTIVRYDELDNKITDLTAAINTSFDTINTAMMHDIKQWIIERHRYYTKQKWISVGDLDMIEARYNDYKKLGGNSTIPGLMKELEELPKHNPTD